LGFSHVPESATIEAMADGSTLPAHHPRWKARQPRDSGAGWDFEDIRDHYLKDLFGLDPIALRSQDTARYYALSRVVTGEVLKRVFAEWRSPKNACGGALVWFFKDLWPGAGWGIVDSTGLAKPVYWYLKRAWAPRSICITDEGLDGLALHVFNDLKTAMAAKVEIALFQHGRIQIAAAESDIHVPAHGATSVSADVLLGHFLDTTYSYRFGPASHDVVVARLKSDDGALLAEDFYFPHGLNLPMQYGQSVLNVQAHRDDDGSVCLSLSSDVFLQSISIECVGFETDDAYFHLGPKAVKTLVYRSVDAETRKFKAYVSALNLKESVTVRVD